METSSHLKSLGNTQDIFLEPSNSMSPTVEPVVCSGELVTKANGLN